MFYQILLTLIRYIIQFFKKNKSSLPQIKQETQFEKSCKRYTEFYRRSTDDENSNIDKVLYDFDKRKELFKESTNEPEKQWKSRVLQENTPRGNVIMHYNPYTHTFVYYSDEQIIPYNVLEQVAKRYVVVYRCKDFFVDMNDRPNNKMLDILQKEEDSLKSKKMKVNDITKCVNVTSDSKDVFASLKDYRSNTVSASASASASTPSVPSSTMITKKLAENSEQKIKFANKYVRIGKMCEFNILQKPPNKKIEAVNELMFGKTTVNKVIDFFDDDDCEDLEIKEEVAVSSYKMFKQLKKN